ncbi:MAG: hypothetical protein KDA61_21290 [Planctomycetales bacterium]|nr:hypothetical protein [Planctomycetales bacterium]
MRNAACLYEGVAVNLEHPRRANDPRAVADQVGVLANVKFDGAALRGDLRLFKSHPLCELILERAAAGGSGLGLSHNADGDTRRQSGTLVVERITRVRSVDVVANPATNKSLFESRPSRWPSLLEIARGHCFH